MSTVQSLPLSPYLFFPKNIPTHSHHTLHSLKEHFFSLLRVFHSLLVGLRKRLGVILLRRFAHPSQTSDQAVRENVRVDAIEVGSLHSRVIKSQFFARFYTWKLPFPSQPPSQLSTVMETRRTSNRKASQGGVPPSSSPGFITKGRCVTKFKALRPKQPTFRTGPPGGGAVTPKSKVGRGQQLAEKSDVQIFTPLVHLCYNHVSSSISPVPDRTSCSGAMQSLTFQPWGSSPSPVAARSPQTCITDIGDTIHQPQDKGEARS